LTPSIKIEAVNSPDPVDYTVFRFPGGELQVRLGDPIDLRNGGLVLRATLTSAEAVFELALVVDALRRRYGWDVQLGLVCPYFPYARQDRVCAPGEALSLKVMCDLINDLDFDAVEIWDPHSDVAVALLDRAMVVPQEAFLGGVALRDDLWLVAPDAGAAKKVGAVSKATGRPVIQASKVRDPRSGAITATRVDWPDDLGTEAPNLLIVDDICDGGRTFIELAKELRKRPVGSVILYVTHGIFSQGLGVFEGLLDAVFCPNPFPNVEPHPLLLRL